MPVHAPVGSFASTGLIHILALLALPLVVALFAAATPAFRRQASLHLDQVRAHFFGPESEPSPAGSGAAAAEAATAPVDDFDYDIYDTPSP